MAEVPRPRVLRHVASAAAWLLLAALLVVGTSMGQRGWGPTLAYQTYVVAAVAVPGLLVKRLLVGAASVLEDLGIGFAVGATGQVLLWAMHQTLGGPAVLMWAGPLLVVATAVLVPTWRRRIRNGPAAPVWFHWVLAALTGLGLVGVWRSTLMSPPMLENHYLYQDYWYHLALNHEMLRAFPLVSPDAVGVPLTYHWFANAYMAAGHLMTGVDLYSILVRQWLVGMFVACMLGCVALARLVSRDWHVAWIAAGITFTVPGSFQTYGAPVAPANIGFLPASPSNVFGLVMLLGVASAAVLLWQGPAGRGQVLGAWLLVAVLAAGSAGAKPSTLPILGFMAAGQVLARLLVGRADADPAVRTGRTGRFLDRISWSGLGVGVLAVAATLLGQGAVSDDVQSGSAVQLGGFLRWMPGFLELAGLPWTAPGEGGLVHPALLAGDGQTRAALIAVGWLALVYAWHWLPLFVLPGRQWRHRTVGWALLAGVAGSWAVFAVVDHPGFSEVYFPRTVVPIAAVLAVWTVIASARASRAAAAATAAAASTGLVLLAVVWTPASPAAGKGSHFFDLAEDVLVLALLVGVVWVVQVVLVRDRGRRAGWAALLLAAVLAMTAAPQVRAVQGSVAFLARTGLPVPGPLDVDHRNYVSAAELEAAAWLAEHSEPYDVVASSTLCTPRTAGNAPNCRGDQFWIPGVSGLRMLISGWYYLPTGGPGLEGDRAIGPRIALSQKLVADPDAASVRTAVEDYGVRWIFADRSTGPVSDRLAEHGTVRFDNGTVRIVEVDRQE